MIERILTRRIEKSLEQFPVVGLIGSRQVGKTTLAKVLAQSRRRNAEYVDLELPSERSRLADPELFISTYEDRLLILDEVQCLPNLFPILRGLVDRNRRPGRFLLLGSASPELVRNSSESLAGRIEYIELQPLRIAEVLPSSTKPTRVEKRLWLRGGYPDSYLARSEAKSRGWREAFLRTFLERDVPQLGVKTPSARLRRFFEMLAHFHGQLWNANSFAQNFSVSAPTVRHYLDLLTDTFMIRQLQPIHVNLKKRLVKAPKIYFRDTGLLHTLLRIDDSRMLEGHPVLGASFEGFAIEQILRSVPSTADAGFFRTHGGAEIDLVLTLPRRKRIAVEIKYSSAPSLSPNMERAMKDCSCSHGFIVTPACARAPLSKKVTLISLRSFLEDELKYDL